jgi:transposase
MVIIRLSVIPQIPTGDRTYSAERMRGVRHGLASLMVAKRSARRERTQAINQARALILTGPDELRTRFAGKQAAALAEAVAALRPRPCDAADYSLRVAPRELGRRVEFLEACPYLRG